MNQADPPQAVTTPGGAAPSPLRILRRSSGLALLALALASGPLACDDAGGGGDAGQGGGAQGAGAGGTGGASGAGAGGGAGDAGGGAGGSAAAIELDGPVVDAVARLLESGGGPSAVVVLREIIARAGFDQFDESGENVYPADAPAQGVAFEWADANLLAASLDGGAQVPLDELLAGWAALAPGLPASSLRPKLIADLRADAASADATRRYWAQIVTQLGRSAPAPFDLLDPAVPGVAPLDALQVALLTYRFQAELWAAAGPPGGGRAPRRDATAGPRPCTMTETEQTVMDAAALGASTFFGELIGLIGESVPGVEKVSKYGGMANSALTVVKLLWTFAALDTRLSSDNDGIVRNWDGTAYGDEATLTATFEYDVGRAAQTLNCVRPALNALGLDFSLPQAGAVASARVDWEMFDVKDRKSLGPIVRYQAGNPPLDRRTDAQGEDRITLEGTKKDPALTGRIAPDHRSVFLAAKVAVKDTKMWQDIQDAVGAALAGNPASMVLAGVAETLVRMNTLAFAARYRLPVEDHQSLDGVVVRVELAGGLAGAVTPAGEGSESVDATVSLVEKPAEADRAGLEFVFFGGQPAAAIVSLAENGRRDLRYRGAVKTLEPCVCAEGDEDKSASADWSAARAGDEKDPALLMATMLEDGSYTLRLPLGFVKGSGSQKAHRSGCDEPTADESERLEVAASLGEITIAGQVDPSLASGTIEGSLSGEVDVSIPRSLGGFYAGGVAHSTVRLSGTVEYAFGYSRTTLTLPAPPPAAPPPAAPLPAAPPPAAPPVARLTSAALPAARLTPAVSSPAAARAARAAGAGSAFARWLGDGEQAIACRATPGGARERRVH